MIFTIKKWILYLVIIIAILYIGFLGLKDIKQIFVKEPVNSTTHGKVKFEAFDQTQEAVENVYFDVYKDNILYDTISIEDDGTITLSNYETGKYTMTKINVPEGYTYNKDKIEFKVSANKTSIVELNYYRNVPRVVVFVKNEQEEPIENAQIQVYDKDGYILCEDVTNSNGKFACNLDTIGTYYFQQTTSAYGYKIDKTLYRMDLDQDENFTFYRTIRNAKGNAEKEKEDNSSIISLSYKKRTR